jgi:uncharacterized protein YbjT (DUF2867 family)
VEVVIIGGTGTLGTAVSSALSARGAGVRVVTRSAAKAGSLPAPLRGIIGDLNRSYTLGDAFKGADALVLILAHSITETGQGLTAVNAAIGAGVQRIVYVSAAMFSGMMRIPHVASKVPVENALITSRADYTILRPTSYFQNDCGLERAVAEEGRYPLPLGAIGVNRIDGRDVADAIINAVTRDGHARRIYTLGGAESHDGAEVAALYAHYLGRPVRYAGDDLERWEHDVAAALPKWQRDDLRIMYRFFQEHGLTLPLRDRVEQERVIGHEPRRFDDYAAALCRSWADTCAALSV